jgi:hypothetical protein
MSFLGVPLRVGLCAAILFLPQAQHKKSISAAIPNAKTTNQNFQLKIFKKSKAKEISDFWK